jgi:hypothetical protein
MFGHSYTTFWRLFDFAPSREFETVVDEYAVTQEFAWLG